MAYYQVIITKNVDSFKQAQPQDATKLLKQIGAYFEGLGTEENLTLKKEYGPFDFKLADKTKKFYSFKILKVDSEKKPVQVRIEITKFL
jgi:hypothetical protein